MIDFQRKIKNTNKFRKPALQFMETGSYCMYPVGTSDYYKYWDEEERRCLEGYIAEDGDYITGHHYFYLNYCPITRLVYKDVINRRTGETTLRGVTEKLFPDFYDYDYFFFEALELATEQQKHLCVLKSRRKGYSYKMAAVANRNYYFIPKSITYIYASNKQYLTQDGILSKAWEYMDHIDKHTAWAKKRIVSTTMHRKSGVKVRNDAGNEIDSGFLSQIQGVSVKDNPDIVRGKRGEYIIWEEAGSCSELAAGWQIARPSLEQDGYTFGTMIAFGTGGDQGSAFATLKNMFYSPEAYNCLGFDNIWDEFPTDKKCGFFIPQYTNLDTRDEKGNRIYMDADGNTLKKPALEFILSERRKTIDAATSQKAIDRYVAERCLTPQEAMLEFQGNIFPKRELQEQLARLRTNRLLQNSKQVGDLIFNADGRLTWIVKKSGDITKYPLDKNDDPRGSIVIWEHPSMDSTRGLYIIGVDPYDHDKAGTQSLGSTLVYKRMQGFEKYYDVIVAEYSGRPERAEEYYENVRKLALYYNAKIMYENERKGIFPYFTSKHCDHLLADQPQIINDIVSNSSVDRRKGCHMNKQLKEYGEGAIKDWLNDEYEPGRKFLTEIKSEPLLEELISYNDKGNFDRVMALMQVMIYRQELINHKVKQINDEHKKISLFNGPIFSQSGGYYDDSTEINQTNVITFNFNNNS